MGTCNGWAVFGVTVKLAKCVCKGDWDLAGRVEGQGRFKTSFDKSSSCTVMTNLRTKSKLMRFAIFYRCFWKILWTALAALTDFLKAKVKNVFGLQCVKAFKQVISSLCCAPILSASRHLYCTRMLVTYCRCWCCSYAGRWHGNTESYLFFFFSTPVSWTPQRSRKKQKPWLWWCPGNILRCTLGAVVLRVILSDKEHMLLIFLQ